MGGRTLDAIVVGAGMAGLSAADELRRRGRSVAVVEAAPGVGGLARSIRVAGEPIEAYYHHVFPQDREIRALIDRLGFGDQLEWRKGPMAVMHKGRAFAFDTPLDLLRFSPLSPLARMRMAIATAVQLVRPDRANLDRLSVSDDGPRWFGRAGYDALWRPLLEAKFGDYADSIAMAWLVARIRQRGGSRGPTGDRLGYLRGSLGTLAEAYGADLVARGIDLRTSTRAGRLRLVADGWEVEGDGTGGDARLTAPVVIACVSGPVLDRIVELPSGYASATRAIQYRGVVCVLLELSRQLSGYYWVNVTDPLGLGCVGIIEHTNLVPADRYGGRTIVYLAHYAEVDGPAWNAPPDELVAAVIPAMTALNRDFTRDWIVGVHVNRDPYAQPVPQARGPMPGLPLDAGLPGLFHASLAHVYPHDRGVSKALALGARAGQAADAFLARPG